MARRFLIVAVCVLLAASGYAQMFATTGGGGNGCCSLYTVNTATGALTLVGTPDFGGAGLPGIDFTPDGRLFAVTGTDETVDPSLVRLDPATGAVVEVIGVLTGDGPTDKRDLAISPVTGTFFATSWDGPLYTINPATAVYTPVGGTNVNGPIAFLSDGTLYMAEMNPGLPAALYTVNTSTGALTHVADLNRYYIGLGRGPDGMLYGADFQGNEQWGPAGGTWGDIYRIDPATGAETFVGSNSGYVVHDIAFVPTDIAVPALAGVGGVVLVLSLLVLGWRRLSA